MLSSETDCDFVIQPLHELSQGPIVSLSGRKDGPERWQVVHCTGHQPTLRSPRLGFWGREHLVFTPKRTKAREAVPL